RHVRRTEAAASGTPGTMEIVGIVNRHAHGMEDRGKPAPGVYVPLAQEFNPVLFLTVRSQNTNPSTVRDAMGTYRRELHELDPDLPILQMVTFPAFMEKNF